MKVSSERRYEPKTTTLPGAALIVLAAALACVPVVLHRSSCGDDLQFHMLSWFDAQQSWRLGTLYPHWSPSANYGAGEPRFIFYPPLTWMAGAALGSVRDRAGSADAGAPVSAVLPCDAGGVGDGAGCVCAVHGVCASGLW